VIPITARLYPGSWSQTNDDNATYTLYAIAFFQKMNYFAQLYDWYSIQGFKLSYIPVCPVTTTGMISVFFEPNVMSTPFAGGSSATADEAMDFER
jgi:hypothetical protein